MLPDSADDPRFLFGRAPISGTAPEGVDIRDSVEFEALEAQIHLMERSGANAANWTSVVQIASDLITNTSKDLLVVAYLIYGLWRKERLRGLAVGLSIMSNLSQIYWDEAFPSVQRIRARSSLFDWLNARLAPQIAAEAALLEPSSDAATAHSFLLIIQEVLDERLGKNAPSLNDLIRAVRALIPREEERVVVADAQINSFTALASSLSSGSSPVSAPHSIGSTTQTEQKAVSFTAPPTVTTENLEGSLYTARDWLRSLALSLLTINIHDSRGYSLLAQSTWLPLSAAPTHRNGHTDLPPPSQERLNDIQSRQSGDPKDFILAVGGFCSGPGLFWLDGQYIIHQALSRMGPGSAAAMRTHDRAIALCLSAFSEIADLSFSDGTPFISNSGRAWLHNLIKPAVQNISSPAEQIHSPWKAAAATAQEHLIANQIEDAYTVLSDGAESANGKNKAYWLVETLRLAIMNNDLVFGLSLSRNLINLVSKYHLLEWDRPLASDIAELAVECLFSAQAERVISLQEHHVLLKDWSVYLSNANITRARKMLKNVPIVS